MNAVTSKADIGPKALLRIGELARRCKKSVRALHLYEELGLLQPNSRSKGGFRLYLPAAAARVEWIGKLQEMGFSLPEIQQFLGSWGRLKTTPAAMHQIRQLFADRLRLTQETLTRLTSLKQEMEESLRYLEKCHTCQGMPGSCSSCEVDQAPMLVAEFHNNTTNSDKAV
jgi:MerR family transcriptional regulator, copper efflux regulator